MAGAQVYFHWTPEPIAAGASLRPAAERGDGYWTYHDPSQAWRATRVWMFATAEHAAEFGGFPGHVYAVIPTDVHEHEPTAFDVSDEGLDQDMERQYHAEYAVVLYEVPR